MTSTTMDILPVLLILADHILIPNTRVQRLLPTTSFPMRVELTLGFLGCGTGELFGTSSLRKLLPLGNAFLILGAQFYSFD